MKPISMNLQQMKKIRLVANRQVFRERHRLPMVLRYWDKCVLLAILCMLAVLLIPKDDIWNVTFRWRHISVTSEIQGDAVAQEKVEPLVDSPYDLAQPSKRDFSRGQSKIIDDLLNHKRNGFFVDVGAGDGETDSVSLFFERERSWEGVLVEKSEEKSYLIINKNRRAILWNFNVHMESKNSSPSDSEIQPRELFRLINRSSFDLLIINLPDHQYELIKSIDFHNYTIGIITVSLHSNHPSDEYTQMTNYLQSNGYRVAHHLIDSRVGKKDVIYSKV